MAGRFRSIARKRCIRAEDKKSNNRVIDKLVVQLSLLSFISDNAIIFIVIVISREDPLSTGMLDVFLFKK